jgi:hypothetical protein
MEVATIQNNGCTTHKRDYRQIVRCCMERSRVQATFTKDITGVLVTELMTSAI